METGVSRWSRNAVEHFGLPGEYFENAGEIWGNCIHPADREMYFQDIEAVFSGKKERHELDYRVKNIEGDYVTCTCRGLILRGKDGEADLFVGTIVNHGIVENIDATTNLYNIYEFWNNIHAVSESGEYCRVLMIGINNFSDVNAIYGYSYGDKVLRGLSDILLELVRGFGKVYRMDGVRFACVLPECSNRELEDFYGRVQYAARHSLFIDDVRISISISGGVVDFHGEYDEYLVQTNAKHALGQSKQEKNGELCYFDNKLLANNRRNLEVLNALRKSIANQCEGYYLCFQPIISANAGEELVGAEALLRWNLEPFGEIPPGMFIPWLENDPSFYELGNWIIREAIVKGKKLLEDYPDFVLNVNIAYTQLSHIGFVDSVKAILEETGYPAGNLCLELTERCRQLEKEYLRKEIDDLKAVGIKIAMDDFGTGFSSLNLLSELPVNTIKIDRGFIVDIQTNETNQAIVEAITNCARKLNVHVCCEGLETKEMIEFIRQYPIYSIQGYYYSKPIRIEPFMAKFC
ncbi:MAG TPA: diguanylate cyclase [Lachnospiraceae bacterium]|nr:diguanylate cyclase [Lachnospiraceae bacterium]